jgi:hypothetical protein
MNLYTEELLRSIDKLKATRDEGRGLDSVPTCPTCSRATVLIEHPYTPQLRLIQDYSEPEHEASYFTCEWCGSEIDPRDISERAPRKPAGRAGEDDLEWARRIA